MRTPEKALLEIYGPHMDETHAKAFTAGWEAAFKEAAKQAEAFRKEDTGDSSRWSIYNQGRADALELLK